MPRAATKRSVVNLSLAVALIVFGGLALMMTGCGDDQTTTSVTSSSMSAAPEDTTGTATEGAGGATASTEAAVTMQDGSGGQRLVVGGKEAGEYEQALPELEKAAAADPQNVEALQELAIAQYNLNKYDEAAATYEKMLAIKDDAFTRNNYANVLRDSGKTEEAKAAYRQAIATDGALVTPYINLASLLISDGDIDAAKTLIEQGIAATQGDDQTRLQKFLSDLEAAGKG